MNICLNGNMFGLVTTDGTLSLKDLADRTVTFWHRNQWLTGKVFKHDKPKKTYAVFYSDGSSIICGENHGILLSDGTEVLAKDIQTEVSVFKSDPQLVEGYVDFDIEQAYIYGVHFLYIKDKAIRRKTTYVKGGMCSVNILYDLSRYTPEQISKLHSVSLKKHPDSYIKKTEVYKDDNSLIHIDKDTYLSDFAAKTNSSFEIENHLAWNTGVRIWNIVTAKARMAWVAGVFDSLGIVEQNTIVVVSSNNDQLHQLKIELFTLGCFPYIEAINEDKYKLTVCGFKLVELGVPFLLLDVTHIENIIAKGEPYVYYKPECFVTYKELIVDDNAEYYGVEEMSV